MLYKTFITQCIIYASFAFFLVWFKIVLEAVVLKSFNHINENLSVLIIRKRDWILFIIFFGIELKSRDDISHFWEAEILSIELPFVSFIHFFNESFAFWQYSCLGIVNIYFSLNSVFMWYDRYSLKNIFSGRIFSLIYGTVSNISKCLISSMIQWCIIASKNMMPINGSWTKDEVVQFWEEYVIRSIHIQKYAIREL